jgi:hypothetical protein
MDLFVSVRLGRAPVVALVITYKWLSTSLISVCSFRWLIPNVQSSIRRSSNRGLSFQSYVLRIMSRLRTNTQKQRDVESMLILRLYVRIYNLWTPTSEVYVIRTT